MVKQRPVLSLAECSKRQVPLMVKQHLMRSAHGIHAGWFRIITGNHLDTTPEELLSLQVAVFREYLQELHVASDRDELFLLVLRGVDEAILKVRRGWSNKVEQGLYSRILETVTGFTEVAFWPGVSRLDFSLVPRTVRSRVLSLLPQLPHLTSLTLGPGSQGGWNPIKGAAAIQLAKSITSLRNLRHFSLKKDCSLAILRALVEASGPLLLLLDLEDSKALSEEAVPLLSVCNRLQELNISGTGISTEGRARAIMALPGLRHLVRADFLCDALGWIEYLEEVEDPLYDLQEFTPSQSYFFHETWQMEMVARMCPNLRKILFIQHPDSCPSLAPLQEFHQLTDLQLHGASWQEGGLQEVLEAMGPRLLHLGLISTRGLSPSALHRLFLLCPNLAGAVFNNCQFEEQDWRSHSGLPRACAPSLTELVVTSTLQHEYITWLAAAAPNLQVLHLGSSTQVRDSTFLELIDRGLLSHLEELQVEKSEHLTLTTLDSLIAWCQELRSVGDLATWEGVSGPELGQIRQVVHEQNLLLDLSSHQVLRRFLGLAGEDRRAMVTLMTGPALERIRLAQAAAQHQAPPEGQGP